MNTSRQWRLWVSTIGSGVCQLSKYRLTVPRHTSIATSFGTSRFDSSPASRLAWDLGRSVLKSGQSGGLEKEDQHCVSISIGKWSELSAEHVVKYTVKARSFVIATSRISGWQSGFKEQ